MVFILSTLFYHLQKRQQTHRRRRRGLVGSLLCTNVLTDIEEDTELFETLLCSYPLRLRVAKNANGRHTDYCWYSSNNDKINYFEAYSVRTLHYKLIL